MYIKKYIKQILSLVAFPLLSFGIVNGWGVYDVYSESYSYGCNSNDDVSDKCSVGEIVLHNDRGGADKEGDYRCGIKDSSSPSIIISGIDPESKWVNIDKYNPIKNLTIKIDDTGAGIRKVKVNIGAKTTYYNGGGNHRTITYNNVCDKFGYSNTSSCYENLLYDGKNSIKITAWDAALDYNDGSGYYSNVKSKTKYVWVDSSRSSFKVSGKNPTEKQKADSEVTDSKSHNNNWNNKTLDSKIEVGDLYGESGSPITIENKTCSDSSFNSFSMWTQPSGVDPNSGDFESYCQDGDCTPSTDDCVFECEEGYVKDSSGECIIQEQQRSCKTYFQDKGYNVSEVDGDKLSYSLDGYGSSVIDSSNGEYDGVYSSTSNDYEPSVDNCQIKPGKGIFEKSAKDENGNDIIKPVEVDGIIQIIGSSVKFILSQKEETCSVNAHLGHFAGGGGEFGNKGPETGEIPIFKSWIDNGEFAKDDDDNYFIDDEPEGSWQYQYTDDNGDVLYTENLSEACGDIECTDNASDYNGSCRCDSGYFPMDTAKDGRYDTCIQEKDNEYLYDTNQDGYYDSTSILSSTEIVSFINNTYSTDKVPTFGSICNPGTSKDTDNNGWYDTCGQSGNCGSSDNGEFLEKPTTNLCNKGNSTNVVDNGEGNPFEWTCQGRGWGSGEDEDCSANHKNDSIDGVCGADDGGDFTSTPTNLCSDGTASAVTDNGAGSTYDWTCSGINSGTDANCSANHIGGTWVNVGTTCGSPPYDLCTNSVDDPCSSIGERCSYLINPHGCGGSVPLGGFMECQ